MVKADESGAKRAAQVDFEPSRVVELGQERLRAMQTASIALDQRVSQVAGFQLAAAALAGSLLTANDSAQATLLWAFWACVSFVFGSLLAFIGTMASHQHAPGLPPSWWRDGPGTVGFDGDCANEWLAIEVEKAIAFNCKEDNKRAGWLNASLFVGLIGGALVAGAAWSRLDPSGGERPHVVNPQSPRAASQLTPPSAPAATTQASQDRPAEPSRAAKD